MRTSWLWAAEVPGLGYRELEARSYRDAADQIRRCFGEEPASLRIVGYRALPDPSAARPYRHRQTSELPTRRLGAVALRLYAVLSHDFPTASILCDRLNRYRFSGARLRDFLANMGTVIQHLPAGQREVVTRRTRAVLESWRHAAAETNARRAGDFDSAEVHATWKEGYQETADGLRRRKTHREAMKTLNLALDGSLPEEETILENWLAAMTSHGVPEIEAREIGSRCQRVAVPRL